MNVLMAAKPRMNVSTYTSRGHTSSWYSRPELAPIRRLIAPTTRPTFHSQMFQTPSFSLHNRQLQRAGVM